MGLRFIFMLTRNDRTVEDAPAQLATALDLGVRHIGFKDVGLPIDRLKSLNDTIRAGGATSYLEVVSLDRESEIASARAAVAIGVDVLLGGTRVADVLPVIAGSGIRYCPFPGRIAGHPSVLEGSIEEIVASAVALAAHDGVHGLDLLAWRSRGDVPALIRAVCAAVTKPVFVAGSIDTPEQIAALRSAGAAGFTIGTAALDGRYPAGGSDVASQIGAIIRCVAALNDHLSPFRKGAVAPSLDRLIEMWLQGGHGPARDMRIRPATIGETGGWTFHPDGDTLFVVQTGEVLMRFRDREEAMEAGECILIPRGVEYSPVAPDRPSQVVVVEPIAHDR